MPRVRTRAHLPGLLLKGKFGGVEYGKVLDPDNTLFHDSLAGREVWQSLFVRFLAPSTEALVRFTQAHFSLLGFSGLSRKGIQLDGY